MQITAQTLGCKLNNAETSAIVEQFRARNWEVTEFGIDSDLFLLNTCSVTNNAEKECRQIIRRILRQNPNAFIAVTGCYAQLRPEEIASIEGVDVVLGAKEKFQFFENIRSFTKQSVAKIFSSPINEATEFHLAATEDTNERTRAFLKVQDGCDYTCSFCTIPMARGESRSGQIENILQEARRLSDSGFHEIVLSGVNVGDFGRKSNSSFYELVKEIEADDHISSRFRISSIEPNLLSDEIIEVVAASKKFCPHFHIPLQSGSSYTLRMMQRRYTPELYRSRVERIIELMPRAAIGVDVIVGFPGETDEHFMESYEFIKSLEIAYLHVFSYSERPDTKAASMIGGVTSETRKDRNLMMRILSEKKRSVFYRRQLGSEANVLLEGGSISNPQRGLMRLGFSDNYVRVALATESIDIDAEMVRVRFSEIEGELMVSKPIDVISRSKETSLFSILQ